MHHTADLEDVAISHNRFPYRCWNEYESFKKLALKTAEPTASSISFAGSVSLKSLQPKAKGRKSSLNLDVNITELSVNLAARHVPMLQSLIKCIPSNKKVLPWIADDAP